MVTATIVVSLPSLKPLIMRITPVNTSNRSNSGYMNAASRRSLSHPGVPRFYGHAAKSGDDEVELVRGELELSRKSSLSPTRNTSAIVGLDAKDVVRVTTDIAVTREVL
jgi:hypothetical protein